jgi:hypothetical protein
MVDLLLDAKPDLSHSLQGLVPATFHFACPQTAFWICCIVLFVLSREIP